VLALWVPCVVVGSPLAAGIYRMTVAASRDVLGEDFVRTALVVYGCIIIAVANMLADLLQERLDPRVQEEWTRSRELRPRMVRRRRRREAEEPGVV
jgi:ABC-type dipeptide/oligopeptide/nickel transport system permease component